MIEPLLVSPADAAKMLGISRSMFYQLLSSGRIPLKTVCFGKKRLWKVDELKRWTHDGCPSMWEGGNNG